MAFRFEWDSRKAAANISKHGVSFDEASTVFDDRLALIFDDELHSTDEVRELIIMKTTPTPEPEQDDDMCSEYGFDYRNARPTVSRAGSTRAR